MRALTAEPLLSELQANHPSAAHEAGRRISKDEMDKMHKKYKESKRFATQSVYFDRATFERLLGEPGVAGVRVYYGVNDKDELHPIFVPANAQGKNILVNAAGASTIEEYGNPCPPLCGGGAVALVQADGSSSARENGKRISKDEMDKMHKKYKESKKFVTQSVYFDRATFERLLGEPGVAGVRVYYGVNDKDELHPIFVPTNAQGKDILMDAAGASTIEEFGNPCPPLCQG